MKRESLVLSLVIAILLSITVVTATQSQSVLFILGVNVETVNPQTGIVRQWEAGSYGVGVSPDGKRVAYATTDSSTTYIWVSDGSNTRKIAEFPHFIPSMHGHLTWSDDGHKIAFLYSKQLIVLDVNTGEWQYVASPVNEYSWRPHSQHIAVVLDGVDAYGNVEIDLLDLAQQTRQLLLLVQKSVEHLTWSPDGNQIAIVTVKATQIPLIRELTIVDINSGIQKEIYSDTTYFNGLIWSPDGQNIMVRTTHGKILLVDPTGARVQLVSEQAYYRGNAWSSDGKFIAYLKEDQETHDPILAIFEVESGLERVLATHISPSVDLLVWR